MKNAKVALKFTLLVVPLLLLAVVAVIMFATQSTSIFNSSKETFYDEILVSTSSIINAENYKSTSRFHFLSSTVDAEYNLAHWMWIIWVPFLKRDI